MCEKLFFCCKKKRYDRTHRTHRPTESVLNALLYLFRFQEFLGLGIVDCPSLINSAIQTSWCWILALGFSELNIHQWWILSHITSTQYILHIIFLLLNTSSRLTWANAMQHKMEHPKVDAGWHEHYLFCLDFWITQFFNRSKNKWIYHVSDLYSCSYGWKQTNHMD